MWVYFVHKLQLHHTDIHTILYLVYTYTCNSIRERNFSKSDYLWFYRFVKQALRCTEMHGHSCDMRQSPLSESWYNSSVWMVHVLCKDDPAPNPVLSVAPAYQLEGLFSLLSLLGNPYSTKETICP